MRDGGVRKKMHASTKREIGEPSKLSSKISIIERVSTGEMGGRDHGELCLERTPSEAEVTRINSAARATHMDI